MMRVSSNSSWKRGLSVVLGTVLLTVFFTNTGCERQQEKRKYVIGYVNPSPEEKGVAEEFLRKMQKFGYVEGKNLKYIKSEGKKDHEADLKDMVSKQVDLIFTITTPVTKMAKKITEGTNIPVVFVVYDAVESGLVKSLIDPGGNLTGVQLRGSVPKAVEWLLMIVPGAKRIFVPVKFDTGAARMSMEDLKKSAAKSGLELIVSEVATAEELNSSLASMPKDIDAVFIVHSIFIVSNIDTIINASIKRKVPLVSSGHEHYKRGALISYGDVDDRTGLQAARLANGIMKGTRPADLPVEEADFSLGVNLKTARAIGIEISNDILQQTEYIIRE